MPDTTWNEAIVTILLPLPSRLRPGKLARRRRRDAKRRADRWYAAWEAAGALGLSWPVPGCRHGPRGACAHCERMIPAAAPILAGLVTRA